MSSGVLIYGLAALILFISPLVGLKPMNEFEKNCPFECGFDPKGPGHMYFSLRFFLIAVVFLIFDVEIALILPLVMIKSMSLYTIWGFIGFIFLIILLLGTYYEWNSGALDWKH